MTGARFRPSHNTSQFLPELIRRIFPDSKVAAGLSMCSYKLSLLISHSTGHYLTIELIRDVCKVKTFSLLFNECTMTDVGKQCDLYFRYRSEIKNTVCTRCYKSIFFGNASADIVSHETTDSLKVNRINIGHLSILGKFLVSYLI